MCGGLRTIFARSDAMVSPVRTLTRMRGTNASTVAMPVSGTSRFFWMSLLSALSGEM